jgi:hypothetical protein
MNVIKITRGANPHIRSIVNLEDAIGWTVAGWIGERSVPNMVVLGNSSAKSTVQIPVPIPRSRALSISYEMGRQA